MSGDAAALRAHLATGATTVARCFRLERRGPDGKPLASEGRYLTVWARDAGDWRVALDCGLQPAGALGPVERVAVRSLVSEDGKLEAAIKEERDRMLKDGFTAAGLAEAKSGYLKGQQVTRAHGG